LRKHFTSTATLIFLAVVLTILCTQSFFNDSFYLSYIPTSRSYLPFSPTAYKLLIVYILILQSIQELESNPSSMPLSLLILSLTYLTTLPLLIIILGVYTCFHHFKLNKRKLWSDLLILSIVFGAFIILLISNTSDDIHKAIGSSMLEQYHVVNAMKFAVISWIQSFAQLWFFFVLCFILIRKLGLKNFFKKYEFYCIAFVICFFVGAGIFPYLKNFGFDNDQFYYNLMMPISFCLNVFFISEIIKLQLFKNYIFIAASIISFVLSSKQLMATWSFYRPLSCTEIVTDDFIHQVNNRLNKNHYTNKGIAICALDTTHFAYHNGKEEFIVIGNSWAMCYLDNAVYPSNFSKFYFKENGKELMENKTYFKNYIQKTYPTNYSSIEKNKLIGDFIKDNDVDYLLSDLALPNEITHHFKDTIQSSISTLRVYVK
jgi:hypothetical protein